jgi:hypothetical protein
VAVDVLGMFGVDGIGSVAVLSETNYEVLSLLREKPDV